MTMTELNLKLHPDDLKTIRQAAESVKMDVADYIALVAYKTSKELIEGDMPATVYSAVSGIVFH